MAQPLDDRPERRDAPIIDPGPPDGPDTENLATGEPNLKTPPVSNESEPVSLTVENVSDCGDRCRRVTANLTNVGNETLTNVTAETRVLADGNLLWNRTHDFETLSVNESANRTARIDLGLRDALVVAGNDGWVTVETTVSWDGGNATFDERRRVR
jgi:hypothetical protein